MRLFTPIIALSLCSCATISPQRCVDAARGLTIAAEIAQVLIANGVEASKAQKLADAVATGQMLLAVACAQSPPTTGP